MHIKVGRFRKAKDGMWTAPVELDKQAADSLFNLGMRALIAEKKAKVVVLTPDEAKKLGIKPKKSVEISDTDYNACISWAMVEALKDYIKGKKGK